MSTVRGTVAWGLAIHGGVGTIPRERMTAREREAYLQALESSLRAGHEALAAGGSALDAVEAAVREMEDSPLFNAGRGSNYDERGVITMDASIMDGAAGDAGAVAAVTRVRNPITLARRVMERSPHLLLVGEGAETFGAREGIAFEVPEWFGTERRRAELARALARGQGRRPNVLGDDDPASAGAEDHASDPGEPLSDPADRAGTVGAVALDVQGRLAAATSTGGMAGRGWGRVGDTPIPGAGTWAGRCCAVSCTGWGELFIRTAAAHEVEARMIHGGATLGEAVRGVVFGTLEPREPRSGGLVAMDAAGRVECCFNTPGMYRGWIDEAGRVRVDIHGGPSESDASGSIPRGRLRRR